MSFVGPASPIVADAAGAVRFYPHNLVVPALFVAGAIGAASGGFVSVARNRLVAGQPIGLLGAGDWRFGTAIAVLGAVLLALSLLPPARARQRTAAAIAGALLLIVLAAAGHAAAMLSAGLPNAARISLGPAFWVLFGAAALAVVDSLRRARAGLAFQIATATALVGAGLLMARSGLFDALSLTREYETRQAAFAAALLRHVVLVAAAVGPALAIGVPLGVAAAHRPPWQGPLFAVLNLLQTVPSIALFGLLLVPLSALAVSWPVLAALGIGGVGVTPAVIALVLYALLPIVRNAVAGIAAVDPAVKDAAQGMGMTPRQLFWQVELALALPLLFAGLRIVTVQAIGLAVVAALIGAGGLGSFVFAGLGQYATDLVLLGALPAIGLALAADFLLRIVSALALRRFGSRR